MSKVKDKKVLKRLRFPTTPGTEEKMDVDEEIPILDAGTGTSDATADIGVGTNSISKGAIMYTGIKDHPSEGQLYTNTRTANLKWEGYFSVHHIGPKLKTTSGKNNEFAIYLNHPYIPLYADFNTSQVNGQNYIGSAAKSGLSVYPASDKFNSANAADSQKLFRSDEQVYFPRQCVAQTPTSGTLMVLKTDGINQSVTPTWRAWYNKMYEYYHTLESRYVVTITHQAKYDSDIGANPVNNEAGVLIGVHPEAYVQSNISDIYPTSIDVPDNSNPGTAQTVPLEVTQAKNFKNIQWHMLNPKQPGVSSGQIKITGKWTPGSITGSVKNLEDIKQWYPTGSEPDPMWHERHVFWLFSHYAVAKHPTVNVHVEVEFKVQFKDLKPALKFKAEPTPIANAISLRCGIDDIQYPYPILSHRTAEYDP